MDQLCRLCCSSNFVNNYIFDEETALHLKMSLYMPIKVLKDDRLPQKICNKCSCKVNDFYQFCNEAIAVQNRLVTGFLSCGLQLAAVKRNNSPEPASQKTYSQEKSTQTEAIHTVLEPDFTNPGVEVKIEPRERSSSPIVKPDDELLELYEPPHISSDDSDNMSLHNLKKKKKTEKKSKHKISNGVKKSKSSKKHKKKIKKWEDFINALPEGTTISVDESKVKTEEVKSEEDSDGLDRLEELENLKKIKAEPSVFNCCMCRYRCYSRTDMIAHYKEHGDDLDLPCEPPPPPPPPDQDPVKCPRCSKSVPAESWGGHWTGHWARDRRPYRCIKCERAFRDPMQIFKHGQTHDEEGEAGGAVGGAVGGAAGAEEEKRFICDLCPEGFVYMRYLLSHRSRAHPEAASVALALRCAVCRRSFAHTNSLRRHLRAHTGERNYLCNVCGKSLTSREHLKFHIRIHTGYKPNVCKTCGKGFVKKCNLTLHERTHSGEKPHVCSHCNKAFSQRSTLVIHERYHSGARPYVCSLCGRGFVAKGLLSMHLKTTCI